MYIVVNTWYSLDEDLPTKTSTKAEPLFPIKRRTTLNFLIIFCKTYAFTSSG